MKSFHKDVLIKMKDQDSIVEESSEIKKLEDQAETLYNWSTWEKS